jgi:threonine-phosphate decarboxylase
LGDAIIVDWIGGRGTIDMGLNPHGGDHHKEHKKMIDFSVNVHPLGFPKGLKQILNDQVDLLPYYPEIDGYHARGELAEVLDVSRDELILGNGAVELIYLYARLCRGKSVLIIGPTFNEYERAFRLAGAHVFHFLTREEEAFTVSTSKLESYLKDHSEMQVIVLCHPNNPTGTGVNHIEDFLQAVGDRELLVDESFWEFTELDSFLPYINENRILVLRSMTKFYALAGLRVGYGCGSKELIARMTNEKEPWTLNQFALASIPYLIRAEAYQNEVREWVYNEKQMFLQALKEESSWIVYPGHANFVLVKFPFELTAIRESMKNEGFYFRICTDFQNLGPNFGRFTIRDHEEGIALIRYLQGGQK